MSDTCRVGGEDWSELRHEVTLAKRRDEPEKRQPTGEWILEVDNALSSLAHKKVPGTPGTKVPCKDYLGTLEWPR